jgi:hexosaminidase
MMFWGDIIIQHPDLVSSLPKDVIALPWGYESDHPFDAQCKQFKSAGLEFYVCPGTSAWNSLAGRTQNALGNLFNAAQNGLKYGASGYLITDWGDFGHWQVLPVSYLGFVAGSAFSWCLAANEELMNPGGSALRAVLDQFVFLDTTGSMSRAAYQLGDIYRVPGIDIRNASILFWVLRWPLSQIRTYSEKLRQVVSTETHSNDITVDDGKASAEDVSPAALVNRFKRTLVAIEFAIQPIESELMQRSDSELVKREFLNTARLMKHACHRGIFAFSSEESDLSLGADLQEILEEYRSIWLLRNRPGGLNDSTLRFLEMIDEYQGYQSSSGRAGS